MVNLKNYRCCKNIDRLSGVFKLREYNLLEHQYMVAILFKHFASIEDVSYSMVEFDLVLNHDIVEALTGDLNYEVKNFNEKTKDNWEKIEKEIINNNNTFERYSDENIKNSLTKRQYNLFKACDLLELWIFIKEEMFLGNNTGHLLEIENRCRVLLSNGGYMFNNIVKFIKNYEPY